MKKKKKNDTLLKNRAQNEMKKTQNIKNENKHTFRAQEFGVEALIFITQEGEWKYNII